INDFPECPSNDATKMLRATATVSQAGLGRRRVHRARELGPVVALRAAPRRWSPATLDDVDPDATAASVVATLERVTAVLPQAEDRPGQRRMAERVATAIAAGRHVVVQAGTGTGKTLAYLLPAIE